MPSPRPWRRIAFVLPMVLLALAAVLRNVAASRTLYEYDRATYWFEAARVGESLFSHPLAILGVLNQTLRTADYNYLPAMLPGAVAAVAGPGRTVFVGSLAVFYLLPAVFAWVWLGRRARAAGTAFGAFLVAAPFVLSPLVWTPLRDGYPDVGAMALGLAAAAVLLTPERRRLWFGPISHPIFRLILRLAVAGAMLGLMVLFRRWTLFWAVGLSAAVTAATALRYRRAGWRVAVGRATLTAGVVGVTGFALACLLAWPMPWRMISTDYAGQYAAYRADADWFGTIGQSVAILTRSFGLLPLGLSLVGLVACLLDARRRRPVAIVAGGVAVAFLLFNRTQAITPGVHHGYLVLPALLWPLGIWLARPEKTASRAWAKRAGVLGVLLIDAVLALAPGPNVPWLLSDLRLPAERRTDWPEIARLFDDLGRPGGANAGPIYVLSASPVLNYSQLRSAELSLGRPVPAASRTLASPEVDLRDGLPTGLLFARYVVVCDPVQLSLRPQDQQVVTVPARAMLDGGPFAAAFVRWPTTYRLQDGVTAHVFERTRPTTRDEADTILRALQDAHPGTTLFRPQG